MIDSSTAVGTPGSAACLSVLLTASAPRAVTPAGKATSVASFGTLPGQHRRCVAAAAVQARLCSCAKLQANAL
eukprot:365679-Chlamydomonas_euryale.AAC.38